MATPTKTSTFLPISAGMLALAVVISGCGGSAKKPQQKTPSASNTSEAVTTPPATTPAQAAGTITLEVNGSGDVYAIWAEPFGSLAKDHATLPFSKSFPLPADLNYVALNWTSRDDNPKGCKITVDDKVVVEHAASPTEDPCVFQR